MRIALFVITVLVARVGLAQQSDLQSRANAAWNTSQWSTAAELYANIVRADSNLPQPRFRLGASLVSLKRYNEGIPHLQAAERLGTPVPQAALRLALAFAGLGRTDSAFHQLSRASAGGLAAITPALDSTSEVTQLKRDARYAGFLAALDRNARPCMHDAKYAEFDFWVGTWDVRPTNQPNNPPARSVITKIHHGCVVLESWSTPAMTGQSFNIYDRTRAKWSQTWVDSFGGLHQYWGNLKDGNMAYEGEAPAPGQPGARAAARMTFFNQAGGTVRQLVERSTDGGKTWQVSVDLTYTRTNK